MNTEEPQTAEQLVRERYANTMDRYNRVIRIFGGSDPKPTAEPTPEPEVIEHWSEYEPYSMPEGTWRRLMSPQKNCGGTGPEGDMKPCFVETSTTWKPRRSIWIRWDGVTQCGTCKKTDYIRFENWTFYVS